jgi:hypothetical protein
VRPALRTLFAAVADQAFLQRRLFRDIAGQIEDGFIESAEVGRRRYRLLPGENEIALFADALGFTLGCRALFPALLFKLLSLKLSGRFLRIAGRNCAGSRDATANQSRAEGQERC